MRKIIKLHSEDDDDADADDAFSERLTLVTASKLLPARVNAPVDEPDHAPAAGLVLSPGRRTRCETNEESDNPPQPTQSLYAATFT